MAVISAKAGYVMNDGNPLSFAEWGDVSAPAIVMMAPIRHSAFELHEIAERLQDRYRVIVVNLRGHGDSGAFPTREYNPDNYVADLRAFFTELKLAPSILLGYSVVMSGACIGFAAKYPELVRGLILVDGGLGYTKEYADEAGPRVRKIPQTFPDWEAALKYFGGLSDQKFSTRERHELRAPYVFRQLSNGEVTWKHDRAVRELWPGDDWARNTGAHPENVLENLTCPIFVIKGGDHSHLTVEDCERLTKYGRGSYWETVPDVTQHHVHSENPNAFSGLIRSFLDKVYLQSNADRPSSGVKAPTSTPAVKSGYVMNGTTPLYFHEWGSKDSPDLLFIGPLRAAAYSWKPIIERFEGRFRCVAVNLRAHGDSGPMLTPTTDLNGYVSDIAATIKQLELKTPTVIAFAPLMVGVAVTFASEHPDLLRSLVIIDGGLGLRPVMLPAVKKRQLERPTSFGTWTEAVEFLRKASAPPVQDFVDELAPYHYRRTTEGTIEVKHDLVLRNEWVQDGVPPYTGAVAPSVWERVRCPLFFMVPEGGSLQLPVDEAKRLVSYGEKSEWVEVPKSQHYIYEENPDGFMQALLPFFKRIYGANTLEGVNA